MKTKYKFICFEEIDKSEYYIKNNKSRTVLARLVYYKTWKQFVMQTNPDAVFSQDCLEDIIDFLQQLKTDE